MQYQKVTEVVFDLSVMQPIEVVGRLRAHSHIALVTWRKGSAKVTDEGKVEFQEDVVTSRPLVITVTNLDLGLAEHAFVAQAVAAMSAISHRYNTTYVVVLADNCPREDSQWIHVLMSAALEDNGNLVLVDTKEVQLLLT